MAAFVSMGLQPTRVAAEGTAVYDRRSHRASLREFMEESMTRAFALLLFAAMLASAQTAEPPFSKSYLEPRQYSQAENEALLALYKDARVADVVDGLDIVGLPNVTVMSPEISQLWRDEEKFTHRISGIAVTLRIVPPQDRTPDFASPAEFAKWEGNWYNKLTPGEFARHLTPGTVLVIDAAGTHDNGFCGSNNALAWYISGMRGIVSSGGCRDTDELILQRIPAYHRVITRGINPGRSIVESYNKPVSVGGVLVMPGDVIVADNDGVVVVPRAKAEAVAAEARNILDGDKAVRRKLYEKEGRTPDFTVK
jgi:4-hydroxy-4-methyl-2-oxoglutarate aldolase